MQFHGKKNPFEKKIFTLTHHGEEFFHKTTLNHFPAKAVFVVKVRSSDTNIHYPLSATDTSLSELKRMYRETYGPHSVEVLLGKINNILSEFDHVKKIGSEKRRFLRKLWLSKKFFELIECSMNIFITRLSRIIDTIYDKAVEFLNYFENYTYNGRFTRHHNIALSVIQKVHHQILDVIASDAKFLTLLSPRLLRRYIKNASPYMVAKFGSLPWIEPDILLLIAPHYTFYWTHFWDSFFKRNFNITHDLTLIIAEYMPRNLIGETFLDYFRRAKKQRKHVRVQKSTRCRDGFNVCNITIIFDKN